MHLPLLLTAVSCAALLLALSLPTTPVKAQDQSAISQGFATDKKDIVTGSLVSLQKGSGKVQLADSDNQASLVGITADKPLLSVGDSSVELKVVTSGTTETLISDINGKIQAGDQVAVSPVRGVGMRLSGSGYSVGVAQQDFSETGAESREVTAKDGSKKTIKVTTMPVLVDVAYYAQDGQGGTATPLIQRIAEAVAGKQTSTIRVAIAFTIAMAGLVVSAIILRSSTVSSMISIGRNPLAENIIRKNFTFVVAISFGVLAVALSVAYISLVV